MHYCYVTGSIRKKFSNFKFDKCICSQCLKNLDKTTHKFEILISYKYPKPFSQDKLILFQKLYTIQVKRPIKNHEKGPMAHAYLMKFLHNVATF